MLKNLGAQVTVVLAYGSHNCEGNNHILDDIKNLENIHRMHLNLHMVVRVIQCTACGTLLAIVDVMPRLLPTEFVLPQ